MKKIIIALLVLVIIVMGIIINDFIRLDDEVTKNTIDLAEVKKEESEETAIEEELPLEWKGKYIWDNSNENNTWMCFRNKINIGDEKDIKKVVAQIAVDSKYWLYINDKIVVREGELKRGETRNSIYYDEVDISKYLKNGENTIAVLAWYWGDASLSYNPSGKAAFLFQAKIGDEYIITDDTWKVHKNPAFLQDEVIPNRRLAEYNVYYDARKAEDNWYKSDFDDSSWENATVVGEAEDETWGAMIKRDIPQFKNKKLKEYENMSEYKNYETTVSTEVAEMEIPYNAQFMPYLEVDAPEGKKITIQTDQYEDINGDSVMCTYITKEGVQKFESPAWINGEKVFYEIPEGVKILKLGYRETGYDSEMTGSFKSDDKFFNKLWKMASRTLYVNMRDTYMDCPNRERAQWWGDVSIEMLQAMYAMDTKSYDLYEKGVKTTMNWRSRGNLIYCCTEF